MARSGVTDPDAVEQAMKISRAFEELCPSLSEQARTLTDRARQPVADLQALVDRRQSELARQVLRDADAAEIERAVRRLRQTFGGTPGDELRRRLREAVDDVLRLAGADGGQRVVKIVSDSALGILEDLESYMAEPIPQEIGDPDRVPMALTLREILEHCAMVKGANQALALWIIRQVIDHTVRWLGADDLGIEPRGMLTASPRNTARTTTRRGLPRRVESEPCPKAGKGDVPSTSPIIETAHAVLRARLRIHHMLEPKPKGGCANKSLLGKSKAARSSAGVGRVQSERTNSIPMPT